MDLREKVSEIASKLNQNPELLKEFGAKPTETVKKLLNTELSDDAVNAIVAGLKGKLSSDKLGRLGKLLGQ